jgi:hypothetical protein
MTTADESTILRSAVLSDMHQVDPEGCVRMPFDTNTWRAWLTDDPSRITTDKMELFLSVIQVRRSYTRDFWMLAGAATCSIPWAKGERQRCYLRQA